MEKQAIKKNLEMTGKTTDNGTTEGGKNVTNYGSPKTGITKKVEKKTVGKCAG